MHLTLFKTPIIHHILWGIARLFLLCMGWKCIGERPEHKKYIAIAAPHTSNWDFPILFACALKLRLGQYWMGKDSLFKSWYGWFFKWLGGIPVDRSKSNNVVEQMAQIYTDADALCVGIAPEATRKANSKWKSGFYHIAVQAKIPILIAYIDYGKKEAGIGEFFEPTGDFDADMKYIQEFYRGVVACHPDRFAGEYLDE